MLQQAIKQGNVSTHSRPKAAGKSNVFATTKHTRFNSQPPEGGWQNRRNK